MPAAWHSAVASPRCSTTPCLRLMSAAGPVSCRPSPLPSRYHSRYCPASRDQTNLRGPLYSYRVSRMAVRDGLQIGDGSVRGKQRAALRQAIDVGREHAQGTRPGTPPNRSCHPRTAAGHPATSCRSSTQCFQRGPLRGVFLRVLTLELVSIFICARPSLTRMRLSPLPPPDVRHARWRGPRSEILLLIRSSVSSMWRSEGPRSSNGR